MERSTSEVVRRGLRCELMPVSMLTSAAVSFCLVLKKKVTYFTSDKAYGRAAVSQGDVGKRWKTAECFYDTRILRAGHCPS